MMYAFLFRNLINFSRHQKQHLRQVSRNLANLFSAAKSTRDTMERVWSRRESCSLKQQLFKYQKSQHQTPRSLQHISPTPILCTVPTHICSPAVSVCSFQLKPMSQHHHFGRWSWQLPSLAQLLSGNINQFSFLAIHYQKHPQRRSKQQSLTSS